MMKQCTLSFTKVHAPTVNYVFYVKFAYKLISKLLKITIIADQSLEVINYYIEK